MVPQAYLKGWADGQNRVRVFDGRAGRTFITDTKNAAVRSKIYTIQLDDGSEDAGLEGASAQAENDLIAVIRDLRSGQWPLTSEGRVLIANFIALQIARAPWIPEATEQMIREVTAMSEQMESAMDQMRADLSPSEYERRATTTTVPRVPGSGPSYTLDEFVAVHRFPTLRALAASVNLIEPLAHVQFTLLEAREEEFFTTDQPIVHWAPEGQPEWMGTGLLTAERSTLPISPHLCLEFRVPDEGDELDARRILHPFQVALVNQRTFRDASRHIVMRPGQPYFGFEFPD